MFKIEKDGLGNNFDSFTSDQVHSCMSEVYLLILYLAALATGYFFSNIANQLKLANFWGKKRSNSSIVWDHFGFECNEDGLIIDKTKAVCKHCSAEIKYIGGNTSNLSAHFSSHHIAGSKPAQSVAVQPTIHTAFGSVKMFPKMSVNYLTLQQKVAE